MNSEPQKPVISATLHTNRNTLSMHQATRPGHTEVQCTENMKKEMPDGHTNTIYNPNLQEIQQERHIMRGISPGI